MKKILLLLLLLVFVISTIFFVTGRRSGGEGVRPPMVYFNEKLYGTTGIRLSELPSGKFEKELIEKVILSKDLPSENLTSNYGQIGDEFYYSLEDLNAIYLVIKDNEGNFRHFSKFEVIPSKS